MKRKQAMAFLLSAIMTSGTTMSVFANDIRLLLLHMQIQHFQMLTKMIGFMLM